MSASFRSRCATLACLLAACAAALAQPEPSPARTVPSAGERVTADEHKLDIEAMRRSVRDMKFEEAAPVRTGDVLSAEPDPGHQRFREKFDSGKRADCLTAFQGMGSARSGPGFVQDKGRAAGMGKNEFLRVRRCICPTRASNRAAVRRGALPSRRCLDGWASWA